MTLKTLLVAYTTPKSAKNDERFGTLELADAEIALQMLTDMVTAFPLPKTAEVTNITFYLVDSDTVTPPGDYGRFAIYCKAIDWYRTLQNEALAKPQGVTNGN